MTSESLLFIPVRPNNTDAGRIEVQLSRGTWFLCLLIGTFPAALKAGGHPRLPVALG
jgi:hypothetical protein